MKLSRLEIYGFKSFAKKLDLQLTGGITSIVGPNGCGKTNVVDAIRWVLGEQRPTQIRLEKMEDVLFKGSANRRPLGFSEVSLTIDNEAGILPLSMSEITITRRLYRSGESEYMINRKPCRLADIHDLLMDTGMGTDSYSLFEQSMINSILSNKTEDRRHIFEEAAGVTKYKARRKSALNKLISIENDLERVGDIVAELQRRVDSLKRQASKARRYRELKTDLKNRTIALAAHEIRCLRENRDSAASQLDESGRALEKNAVAMSRLGAEIEKLSAAIVDTEQQMGDIGRKFNESIAAITEKEKEIAGLDSRLRSLEEMALRSRENAEADKTLVARLEENRRQSAESLETCCCRLADMERAYREKHAAFEAVKREVDEQAEKHGTLELEYRSLERGLSHHRMQKGNLEAKRDGLQRRRDEIAEILEDSGNTLISLNNEIASREEAKLVSSNHLRDVSDRLGTERERIVGMRQKGEKLDGLIGDLRERHATVEAQRDFLDQLLRSYEGFGDGVKNAAESGVFKGRLHGVLGDIVAAEEDYVAAVEAALADSIEWLVVDTVDDALAGVSYLRDDEKGEAAFVSIDGNWRTPSFAEIPEGTGVVGPLAEHVRAPEQFMPIVKRVLEDVILVDSAETAAGLQARHHEFRFVARDGTLAGKYGELRGGRVSGEYATIGRRQKLAQLSRETDRLDKKLEDALRARAGLQKEMANANATVDTLEQRREELRTEQSDLVTDITRITTRRDSLAERIKALHTESNGIVSDLSGIDEEIDTVSGKMKECEQRYSELHELLRVEQTTVAEKRETLEEMRTEVNQLQVSLAGLTEKKASLERELAVIDERRDNLSRSGERTAREIERSEQERREIEDRKKALHESLAVREQEHEKIKREKETVERSHADLRTERSDRERELQDLRRVRDELDRTISRHTLIRDEAEMKIRSITERIADEYYIDTEEMAAAEPAGDFDADEERLLLEDLRRKIHGLGEVNLAAETDYEEEKKRLDFLVGERDDLEQAGKTLRETIDKINRIARARFLETFESIRENFRKMFNDFFDGGTCDLELEEDIDPLEGNILISARPPGKNIRTINLLSSGERALTAISLLFAIYLVKPSPFCILDEVDAPLDDANLDRYLNVIREFSRRTQFIMVTHNKKTMAEADNLYGITMEEPGLSSLVSVRLSEVDNVSGENKEPVMQ